MRKASAANEEMAVEVQSIDDYNGMIFHNKSNIEALAFLVQDHVKMLYETLRQRAQIYKLKTIYCRS